MKQETKNVIKLSMEKIQEAIDLLNNIEGYSDGVDEVCDELRYKLSDLEYEMSNIKDGTTITINLK